MRGGILLIDIKVGECYTISDNIPSNMMLVHMENYYYKQWVKYLSYRKGERIKVRSYYERDGIPVVEATGLRYIIPIDCLVPVEYDDEFNPDEEVSFF